MRARNRGVALVEDLVCGNGFCCQGLSPPRRALLLAVVAIINDIIHHFAGRMIMMANAPLEKSADEDITKALGKVASKIPTREHYSKVPPKFPRRHYRRSETNISIDAKLDVQNVGFTSPLLAVWRFRALCVIYGEMAEPLKAIPC